MLETLGDVLRHNAHKFADKLAIVYGERRITFSPHFERCQRTASALYRMGVRTQDRVAVMSQNCPEYLEVYGAAELAGFIVATVNFRLAAAEVEYVLESSRPKVLFLEEQYAALVDGIRARLPFIENYVCFGAAPDWALGHEEFVVGGSIEGAPVRAKAPDMLHLIFTSGTTGRPKGVMRSNYAELKCAELWATEIGIKIDDRMQLMMPLFHVGARWLQSATHFRAGAIVLHHDFVPADVVRTMERERITISHMAPTMVQSVLDVPEIDRHDLSSLHTICYSAAPMPVPLLRRGIKRLGQIFLQVYATTEGGGTTLYKHQHNPDGSPEDLARLASVGQAAPSVGVRVVNEKGEDVPLGEVGEIALSTESRLTGYWNNTIATIEALRDGWYFTGDMGRMDKEGFVYLVDRKKDIIISGGENISSLEVENCLCQHPAVAAAAVVAQPDPKWGETPCAFIELRESAHATEAELIEFCREHIARFKAPKRVVFGAIPRTSTGKVQKFVLREQAKANAAVILGPAGC